MSTFAERYADAAARLTAVVDAVPDGRWSSTSPCEGWTARDVLAHVVSSEVDFLTQRELPVPAELDDDPVRAWPAVRDAVQSILDDPATATRAFDGYFGPTTVEETIDRFYTFDLRIHRWDIGHATGLDAAAALDDAEMDMVRAAADSFPAEVMRSPGLFGPEVEVGPDADEQTRLLAYLGRRV